MIESINLRSGSSNGSKPLSFPPGHLTVFVGPNNSGKSLVLRELEAVVAGKDPQGRKILDSIDVKVIPESEARELVNARLNATRTAQAREGHIVLSSVSPVSDEVRAFEMTEAEAVGFLTKGNNPDWVRSQILSLFVLRLDGHTRLTLVNPRPAVDMQSPPTNVLASLFRDRAAREVIRSITFDAFGRYFVVDPTGMTQLRVRMSSRLPTDEVEEQALDERSRNFHAAAPLIQELSDGVRAFTGLVLAVHSSDFRVMLVDEPEAFLHPPLARMLGRTLADVGSARSAHVIAATHSADFLMGAVESGKDVQVVRLTYESDAATARRLPSNDLATLMRDPLLRSTGLLSALFHRGAVVCEADSDRAFYQEINHRLLVARKDAAVDALFTNAHSKSVLGRLAKPLRQLGIPAAVVVDLDIIKVKEEFKTLLNDCSVPSALVQAWQALRGNVVASFDAGALDMKKGGISLLTGDREVELKTLLAGLADYGIFVVPFGEAESWLKHLNVASHGNQWLEKMLTALGSDPSAAGYVTPGDGDVWEFIGSIGRWMRDPTRKGIPT